MLYQPDSCYTCPHSLFKLTDPIAGLCRIAPRRMHFLKRSLAPLVALSWVPVPSSLLFAPQV